MMNQNNEPEQVGQNIETNISEEHYNALISELSRECLRLETENAELTKQLNEQQDSADQKQNKEDMAAFMKLVQENQARR